MNDPRARQTRFNAESRDQWPGFAEHRRRVTSLLAQGSGRLCVLGAGNGNDLDLVSLLEIYRQVHLVDLDGQALIRGAERQGVASHPGLVRHGNLDVTGMLGAMAGWSPLGAIHPADLDALVRWPTDRVSLALPGPFDVVASTCLLSQLVGNAHHAIGEGHQQFGSVVQAIRLGHLRLLTSLAQPGGKIILITDVATSDRVPEIATSPESTWPGLIAHLAREGGLIHGVNPMEIRDLFRQDPILAGRLHDRKQVAPWRWRLHARTYLVSAIVATVG